MSRFPPLRPSDQRPPDPEMTAKPCSRWALLAGVILIGGAAFTWNRCSHDRLANGTTDRSDPRDSKTGFDSEPPPPHALPSKLPREQEPEPEAARRVREKLDSIIIPVIDFDETSFEEAIDFLRVRARELDSDPSFHDAIKFSEEMKTGDVETRRIQAFSERNISLWKVLKRIASDCRMKLKPTDQGFEFTPIHPDPAEEEWS